MYKMKFGMWVGKELKLIPLSYLKWVVKHIDCDEEVREYVKSKTARKKKKTNSSFQLRLRNQNKDTE
jgi:hypothetical protein